ncbi:methyltransferase [Vibrio tapetis]|uniref:Methyltransferase domain-containing protein n=1 Tax=Vibrio tapetis subsp. tapetis TaxID=1671868 RepID=A0A2N8ZAX3_9VIBR|nr:methyltransferase [Vibrio tapetis]SON49074.1 conserved protein of unknown function [Vibrio tapetis subsp. tapetis]
MFSIFTQIDAILTANQRYWRFEPFHSTETSASVQLRQAPELHRWLMSLTNDDIEFYKQNNASLVPEVGRYIPEVLTLDSLSQLPTTNTQPLPLPRGAEVGVPGRKLNQIVAMSQASLDEHQGSEWLEWCSGKGYLGRILALSTTQPVTSFEWQQSLCDSGQMEANKQALPMTFVQGDALADDASLIMNNRQHAVALHACGDLHVNLIRHGCNIGLPALTIAPCCYHLIQGDQYQALSDLARNSELNLTQSELRIPLQATVTGGERVKRHRYLEMTYRLGLDNFLRCEKKHERYTPLPSIKKSELALGFEHFCRWAAKKRSIDIDGMNFEHWLVSGKERFIEMERMSLIQQVFQRPLEMWLVLDRALYLEQNGYKTMLSEFCNSSDTPRNILIQANRK